MRRPDRNIGAFSLSAVDLFASALGAFMVVVILLLPYFRNLSEVETRRDEARKALTEARTAQAEAENSRDRALAGAGAAEAGAAEAGRRRDAAKARRDAAASAAASAKTASAACSASRSALAIDAMDVAIGIDTTGSMGGEIQALRAEMGGIARVLDRIAGEVRLGVVAYRDVGEPYVTRTLPLTPASDIGSIESFLSALSADGGGDCPEAVERALAELAGLGWRPDARRRVVMVGDAEAHAGAQATAYSIARDFASRGGTVSTVFTPHPGGECSPATAEPFFRKLAAEGGGRFIDRDGSVMEAVLMALLGN